MKIFKFMIVALVAMCGFASCSEDCDHDFIEYDYTQDLVGTWTCMDMDYAEAMVIKADGSVEVTGVVDHEYFESKGTIKVVNNKMIYKLDNGDEFEGRFEMTKGESFTMVWDDELDIRYTYRYCENDLADEIVGMWVDNGANENEIVIQTYQADGKVIRTGYVPGIDAWAANYQATYKVIGDLLFVNSPSEILGDKEFSYVAVRLTYLPNGTSLGDIMTYKKNIPFGDGLKEEVMSFLRVKQNLELPGMKYDYIKTFVSNVKGEDKDIPFLNTSFNFAKMDGSIIDKFLKSILFNVEFPDANTINYSFMLEGQNLPMSAPIEVEGNKMTIKMSANDPVFHDVVVYTFQDKDNSQMHMYMPTSSFEKFFANTSVSVMLGYGLLDKNDADAIAAVYQNVADAVESINLSLVMSKTK